ncbi:MAG: riboflavin synthase [Saprospiraceae bacterium]|nr:MAG: riboflavin synthase [Saprospiraceae bacterium]
MFTGIIETPGTVKEIRCEGTNKHFTVASSISHELRVNQSVAHNGVCLTVVAQDGGTHTVTAIDETLQRSNLGLLAKGALLNLERAMQTNARLDGHMVQGHVDTTAECKGVAAMDGSWVFSFEYPLQPEHILVDKGSICINGVSLTVVSPVESAGMVQFSVAIIPYTLEHTNFQSLKPGDRVNLEFDIIGKYVSKYMALYAGK